MYLLIHLFFIEQTINVVQRRNINYLVFKRGVYIKEHTHTQMDNTLNSA